MDITGKKNHSGTAILLLFFLLQADSNFLTWFSWCVIILSVGLSLNSLPLSPCLHRFFWVLAIICNKKIPFSFLGEFSLMVLIREGLLERGKFLLRFFVRWGWWLEESPGPTVGRAVLLPMRHPLDALGECIKCLPYPSTVWNLGQMRLKLH